MAGTACSVLPCSRPPPGSAPPTQLSHCWRGRGVRRGRRPLAARACPCQRAELLWGKADSANAAPLRDSSSSQQPTVGTPRDRPPGLGRVGGGARQGPEGPPAQLSGTLGPAHRCAQGALPTPQVCVCPPHDGHPRSCPHLTAESFQPAQSERPWVPEHQASPALCPPPRAWV